MCSVVRNQADDAGKEDDLRVILAEVRYNGLDRLTGGQEDGCIFHQTPPQKILSSPCYTVPSFEPQNTVTKY
jgi:hypothetical protein